MSRILVFTGKGGVGKTSIAAAHALMSASEQKHTLLVSTDMAHNLKDLFQTAISEEGTLFSPFLTLLELNPVHIMEEDFKDIKQSLIQFFHSFDIEEEDTMKLAGFPGMDEIICLLKILQIYEDGIYDRIIIDCAPTGETLSLLKFPELLSWYMEKFFPIGKVAVRVLSPVSKTLLKVELPNQKAMSDIEHTYLKLAKLQALLKDRSVCSIRLVAIPEKMVVEETKRNYMYMNLYNFAVDGLYINRILPDTLDNPFFKQWLEIQATYIEELSSVFSHIPCYRVPWFTHDLNGISGIEKIQHQLLSSQDIFAIQNAPCGESYKKTDSGYSLSLYLPCIPKEEIDLHISGGDIIIKIGNFKRNIPIPSTLKSYCITSAKMLDETLYITFEPN